MNTLSKILPAKKLFFLLIFGMSTLGMAQDFEGVIYYEIPEMASQGIAEMPYMVKGSKVRMEFGSGAQGGAMIFMPEENKMALIMEAMKGYMTMELEETASDDESEEMTDMKKTGETKSVAGTSCEVWIVNDAENSFQLCVAQGMGTFMMPRNPMMQANTPQWAKDAMAEGFMPLEIIDVTNGKEDIKMIATKIEEKSLSSALFEIPEGYNDMTGMMKQMMNKSKN